MYRTKHLAEYAALKFVSNVVNVLPQNAAIRLGSAFAPIGFRFNRHRRIRAQERIGQVFGDEYSKDDIARIAQDSYRDLVWHTIEILRARNVSQKWVQRNGTLNQDDRRRLDDALLLGKGLILAVPHLANWDLAGVMLQQLGYRMTFIVRRQKNPLFDRHLNEMRRYLGSEVIERDDPMLVRKVIRSLQNGSIIAMLIDLRARQMDLQVPFLGHTANLARGLGLVSHLASCPVIPSFVTRPKGGRLNLHCADVILPDKSLSRNEDAERIMRAALPPLEAAILAHPDQYFWFNKRWVLEPVETPSKVVPPKRADAA